MQESEEFEQVQPRQIGIAQTRGHQRGIEHQQRRIGRRHNGLALADQACRLSLAQPAARMAGVEGGEEADP
jgi:hypothetical protein